MLSLRLFAGFKKRWMRAGGTGSQGVFCLLCLNILFAGWKCFYHLKDFLRPWNWKKSAILQHWCRSSEGFWVSNLFAIFLLECCHGSELEPDASSATWVNKFPNSAMTPAPGCAPGPCRWFVTALTYLSISGGWTPQSLEAQSVSLLLLWYCVIILIVSLLNAIS